MSADELQYVEPSFRIRSTSSSFAHLIVASLEKTRLEGFGANFVRRLAPDVIRMLGIRGLEFHEASGTHATFMYDPTVVKNVKVAKGMVKRVLTRLHIEKEIADRSESKAAQLFGAARVSGATVAGLRAASTGVSPDGSPTVLDRFRDQPGPEGQTGTVWVNELIEVATGLERLHTTGHTVTMTIMPDGTKTVVVSQNVVTSQEN